MENRQINFFKSRTCAVLKPFKGTVVNIDTLEIRDSKKELNLGLAGGMQFVLKNLKIINFIISHFMMSL